MGEILLEYVVRETMGLYTAKGDGRGGCVLQFFLEGRRKRRGGEATTRHSSAFGPAVRGRGFLLRNYCRRVVKRGLHILEIIAKKKSSAFWCIYMPPMHYVLFSKGVTLWGERRTMHRTEPNRIQQ